MLQGPERNNEPRLYPPAEPFRRFHLPVGDGHELYVEISGTAGAQPVLVLHGGPGAGTSPFMRRFFDPRRYMIVLFDQRGTGRSRPHGSLQENTTWHLVEDIERLRENLGLQRWHLFGGSWGSTLAVLYAQRYPQRAASLILRGLFTMTRAELDWFYGGGAARFYPDEWKDFIDPIPVSERGDLIGAYHQRLTAGDEAEQTRFARPWVRWETATAALRTARTGYVEGAYARAFARIESHYFVHGGWLEEDGQILRDMPRISHIPGVLVQGRYDMICPPDTAMRFAAHWPAGELRLVDEAGHALSEPGIAAELIRATDRFAGPV
ncbi:MAG TPA: prolyl aminopeptidase [Thermohalobaculum sp.]|nr:prolyl aminopeptidase [Thermohalobaculum sp.]